MAQNQDRSSEKAPADADSRLNSVLVQNIDALQARHAREDAQADAQERLAEAVTAFTGSMPFVYIHIAIVVAWVVVNLGLTPVKPFDPTFVILATAASVEAIFLSTFVLISQNRAARSARRQAELDLQTSLLAEHEITRLLALTTAMAKRLNINDAEDPALDELKRDVAPEKVLDVLDHKSDRR